MQLLQQRKVSHCLNQNITCYATVTTYKLKTSELTTSVKMVGKTSLDTGSKVIIETLYTYEIQ